MLVFGNEAVEEISARFLGKYGERAHFSINRPANSPHYVVLTHPQAEKAAGLELVCRELGVKPAEALAMGDSESDLAMLQMAGMGVAMDNSPEGVKQAAAAVAPANDEGGVAWAVRKFVLGEA